MFSVTTDHKTGKQSEAKQPEELKDDEMEKAKGGAVAPERRPDWDIFIPGRQY